MAGRKTNALIQSNGNDGGNKRLSSSPRFQALNFIAHSPRA